MIVLTARQRQALEFIRDCIELRKMPPTLREIGEHMGIRSTNGVSDHLRALERKGYLIKHELLSRAIRLTPDAERLLGRHRACPTCGQAVP